MTTVSSGSVESLVWVVRIGGVAAILGGQAWVLKGLAILVGLGQPPVLVEVGLPLFGVVLLGVAYSTIGPGRRRTAAVGLGAVAAAAGAVALIGEVVGHSIGPALVVSAVALLVGLLLLPRDRGGPARVAWWIGMATVPALAVGGVLAELDEALLEIPLVLIGIAWTYLGWRLLSHHGTYVTRYRKRPRPEAGSPALGRAR